MLNVPLPCQPETSEGNDDGSANIAKTADYGNRQCLDEGHTFNEKLSTMDICMCTIYSYINLEHANTTHTLQ